MPAPIAPELLALIEEIRDNPHEAAARLALADWFSKRKGEGDSARARFIRQHVKRDGATVGRVPYTQVKWDVWQKLEAALVPFAEVEGYMTGLPMIRLGAGFFAPDFLALLPSEAFALVHSIRSTQLDGDDLKRLAAMPELRFVPGLRLAAAEATGQDAVVELLGSPNLTELRYFELMGPPANDAVLRAIAQNPALAKLRRLELYANQITDEGVIALTESPHLGNLTDLTLTCAPVSDAGAKALAKSPRLRNLRTLTLWHCYGLKKRGTEVLRARFGEFVGGAGEDY